MTLNTQLGLASTLLLASGLAQAEWSANLGFASDYYYRGIFQSASSASGGVDYEKGGFYAGSWAADVGEGLEVDAYFGYGGELGDFGYSVGYTGYFYTQDFDDTYQEINLGATYGFVTFDIAIGEYSNFAGPTQDYNFYSLGVEKNGFYGKYAGFSRDLKGEYFEFGYGATVSDIDLGVAVIINDRDLDVVSGTGSESIVFTIGKSFGF